jgi:hypothetical protein
VHLALLEQVAAPRLADTALEVHVVRHDDSGTAFTMMMDNFLPNGGLVTTTPMCELGSSRSASPHRFLVNKGCLEPREVRCGDVPAGIVAPAVSEPPGHSQ